MFLAKGLGEEVGLGGPLGADLSFCPALSKTCSTLGVHFTTTGPHCLLSHCFTLSTTFLGYKTNSSHQTFPSLTGLTPSYNPRTCLYSWGICWLPFHCNTSVLSQGEEATKTETPALGEFAGEDIKWGSFSSVVLPVLPAPHHKV